MRASASLASIVFTGFVVGGAACGSSAPKETGAGGSGGTTGTTSTTTGTTTSSTSSSTSLTTPTCPTVTGTGGFPWPDVEYQGGTLIAAPKIVTVTFPGDSMASQLVTFGASMCSSQYWDTIAACYCGDSVCIGDGPAGTAVALTTPPGASYTDSSMGGASTLHTFLEGLISAKTVPAPDKNTIYALYFPASTTISLDGNDSCANGGFDGYHNSLTIGGNEVFYAVIPECPAVPGFLPPTTLENTTVTASHEFIETASDGSSKKFAFYLNLNDAATYGWNDIQGGEIADLCVDPFGLGQDEVKEDGFTVQRIWSIAQAKAGKNPCVPIPTGEIYFNAYTQYSVLVMDVGSSETMTVTALADGTMPAWSVLPEDWSLSNGNTSFLSYTIAGGDNSDAGPEIQMKSGDTMQLTVTLTADPTNATQYGEADGVIVSANGNMNTATEAHFWPFIVLTTAAAASQGISMMDTHHPHVVRERKLSHARARRPLSRYWR